MTTPEAKVKAKVNKVLARYKDLYRYMPVPSGYGAPSLDYVCCYRGQFFAIETKAPGKKPTAVQMHTIAAMERAGARVFVIDHVDATGPLEEYLEATSRDPHQP